MRIVGPDALGKFVRAEAAAVVEVVVLLALCRREVAGCMLVEFLDSLGRGGKPSNTPGGICWLNLVVLVERADRQSAAGLGPIFEAGEGGVEACFRP
jgi:hypothetical protein